MDVKRSQSCCFPGHNLHIGVTVLRTLSAISFFPSDNFFYIFDKLKWIICTIFLCKIIGHHACLREKKHLFCYLAYFEGNLLRFERARAHVRALITRISCAVGMRNAKLRFHLKVAPYSFLTAREPISQNVAMARALKTLCQRRARDYAVETNWLPHFQNLFITKVAWISFSIKIVIDRIQDPILMCSIQRKKARGM